MNKRYGVVLIGCGHIGQEHIEDIYFRDNIRVVATVDTREEQARLFAAGTGPTITGRIIAPFCGCLKRTSSSSPPMSTPICPFSGTAWRRASMSCAKSPLPVPWRRGKPFTVWLRAPRARCWWPISCGTTVPIKPRPA